MKLIISNQKTDKLNQFQNLVESNKIMSLRLIQSMFRLNVTIRIDQFGN